MCGGIILFVWCVWFSGRLRDEDAFLCCHRENVKWYPFIEGLKLVQVAECNVNENPQPCVRMQTFVIILVMLRSRCFETAQWEETETPKTFAYNAKIIAKFEANVLKRIRIMRVSLFSGW